MPFLLDTNICIEYLRGRNLPLRAKLQAMSPADIFLCSVVLGELYAGAFKSQNPASNIALIENLTVDIASLPFNDDCGRAFGQLKADLERQGTSIGSYDMQIAAIALVHGLTVVNHNVSEFTRVKGLIVIDW